MHIFTNNTHASIFTLETLRVQLCVQDLKKDHSIEHTNTPTPRLHHIYNNLVKGVALNGSLPTHSNGGIDPGYLLTHLSNRLATVRHPKGITSASNTTILSNFRSKTNLYRAKGQRALFGSPTISIIAVELRP